MRFIFSALAIYLIFVSNALAYDAGDIFVRGGLAGVTPNESSDGIAIPALGIAPISNTEAEVDLDTQLGLTITYMVASNWGVELLAATPFTHDITANLDGFQAGLSVPAGEAHQLPPTLSVVYYPFAGKNTLLEPYLGIGVNYTIFFDTKVDPQLEALTGTLAGTAGPVPLKLDLDNSVGLALQIGADYAINEKWHVNASVRWIDLNTDATFTSTLGDTITVQDIEVDPIVWQLNIGYLF